MAHVTKGTRYYSEQVDRHGTPVYYYRRPGFPRIRLNEKPGTPAMDRAFHRAAEATDKLAAGKAAGVVVDPDRPMVACKRTTNPDYIRRFGDTSEPGAIGTLRHLCDAYISSAVFAKLDPATQSKYRRNLRRACALRTKDGEHAFGEWITEAMELKHVEMISARLKDAPTVADNTCKDLRVAFNWAIGEKLHKGVNPATGFAPLRNYDNDEDPDADGLFTWEDWHLERFMKRHPIGTRARLAFALMYYGGVRMSDALRLGPWHVKERGTELHFTEWKGSRSNAAGKHRPRPKHRKLRIHPELARTIAGAADSCFALMPDGRLEWKRADLVMGRGPFVLRQDGQPYTNKGLDWAVKAWIEEAGLPAECTPHGMRKAAAALMYLGGASESEMCAVFGWKIGSRMAAHYAKKFDKQRAQVRAFTRLPQLGGESEKGVAA